MISLEIAKKLHIYFWITKEFEKVDLKIELLYFYVSSHFLRNEEISQEKGQLQSF